MEFKKIFGCPANEVLRMEYGQIVEKLGGKGCRSAEEMVVVATQARKEARSGAETLACSRIISAFIGGPDVMDC